MGKTRADASGKRPYNYKDRIHICNAVRRRIEQEIPRGLTTSSISTAGEMGSSW
jgi:hypothetical protein